MATRPSPDSEDKVTISAPNDLRALGFADLTLEKFGPEHQDSIVYSIDLSSTGQTKTKYWTELLHLVSWSEDFLKALESNKSTISILELMRGSHDFPISKARFHVDEAQSIVRAAINFEVGLDLQHPNARDRKFINVTNIMIDDSTGVHEVIRQVFIHLFSKCVVLLVVKSNQYYSSTLVAFLVDLMHQSGATSYEVNCLAYDRRDSLGSEMRFIKCLTPIKHSKLSVIATVFKQTDTFAAAQGIIESYFREQHPNLIILVEESSYERFIRDWQRYYSHAVEIGFRTDIRTSIVDVFNSKVLIDLNAIDIKHSHKSSGNAINILKFRSLSDLISLLGNLRKVPYMSVWNDDILLMREFCLRLNICQEYWLNHVPKSLAGHRIPHDMLGLYAEVVAPDMTDMYNSIMSEYGDDVENIRKIQMLFMKKDPRLRNSLVLQAYGSLLNKNKSFKNGMTVEESIARLRRFQQVSLNRITSNEKDESRLEIIGKPVGLAIALVREELSLKLKSVLVDFTFKNLMIGNGVLLVCSNSSLETKLSLENDHIIPFKVVHEGLPDMSRLSLDASTETQESSPPKKQCPKNTYVFEMIPDITSDACEGIITALGIRYKTIWYPDSGCVDYWSNED